MKAFLIGMTITLVTAGITSWLIFFRLAPLVASAIPGGTWKALADVGVYVLIAYFGGIAIPLCIVGIGFFFSVAFID